MGRNRLADRFAFTLRGIRRTIGTALQRKAPVSADCLQAMIAAAPDNLAGLRDRALLLIGFAAALRRSELVALDLDDLKWSKAGLQLRLRASKTDQERQGVIVAITPGSGMCPIAAFHEWLAARYRSRPGLPANARGRPRRGRATVRSDSGGDHQELGASGSIRRCSAGTACGPDS
jgi:integrase